jgi:hypothetical protein
VENKKKLTQKKATGEFSRTHLYELLHIYLLLAGALVIRGAFALRGQPALSHRRHNHVFEPKLEPIRESWPGVVVLLCKPSVLFCVRLRCHARIAGVEFQLEHPFFPFFSPFYSFYYSLFDLRKKRNSFRVLYVEDKDRKRRIYQW